MSVFAGTSSATISRRAFRGLIAVWLLLAAAAVLLMIVFGATKAQAMEPLPLPKLLRDTAGAEFTQFSSVPSQSLAANRCQSLLTAVRQDMRSEAATSSNRRTAGATPPDQAKIQAIRAYRTCMSQTALQELTAWRWSR